MTNAATAPVVTTAMKTERDRFVALAFCWADVLFEVDQSENIVFVGGPIEALTGQSVESLTGKPLESVIFEQDRGLVHSLLGIANKQGRIEDVAIRLQGRKGPTLPLAFAGYNLKDLGDHYFLALRIAYKESVKPDPSGRAHEKETKLYTADSFTDVVSEKIKQAAATGEDSKMTLINMPNLSEMREKLDEEANSELMNTVGVFLRANSIDGDAAARLGDDSYGLVHGADLDVGELERQLAEASARYDPEGKGVAIESATLNVDNEGMGEEDLANGLVYAINRFRDKGAADFSLHNLSTNLSTLVEEAAGNVRAFKAVVSERDFDIVFHPIIDVMTGITHHYEVLTRFRGDKAGQSPFETITMAEEIGLISEFDLAVAEKSIEWLAKTPRNSAVSVAVNMSGNSLENMSYLTGLHNLLRDNLWTQGRVLFEITESSELKDINAANQFIQTLRKDRYEVCLDDFGAGAASFGYLMNLEVDVVKLDGPVVRDARKAGRGEALLRSMATLCSGLGIETVAEMIDEKAGLDFVRKCGIQYVQGYLFGKPSDNLKTFDKAFKPELFPKYIKGQKR